jgi:hypothetical protein
MSAYMLYVPTIPNKYKIPEHHAWLNDNGLDACLVQA